MSTRRSRGVVILGCTALVLAAVGCADEAPPLGTAQGALEHEGEGDDEAKPLHRTCVAHLDGDAEVPANDSKANGQAIVKFRTDHLEYRVNVGGIRGVTGAHIHNAPAGVNGGVVVNLGPVASGPGKIAAGERGADEVDLAGLLAMIEAGEAYVNVHTEAIPSGEVRGQLRCNDDDDDDDGPDLAWALTCTGSPLCFPDSDVPPCPTGADDGVACDTAGAECAGPGPCNATLICQEGPSSFPPPCPISRAKYKTDIQYLDDADRQALASQVSSMPLATWRYTHEGVEARARLGFIIEDVEPSAAVVSERDHVDLYGYTTMAVAAIQEQQKLITELRAELADMKARMAELEARAK